AVITEFARWVNPRDARSTQSPSRAVSIAGQAPTMTRWRSSTDRARCGLPRPDPRITVRPGVRCVHGPHSMSGMTYVIAQPCVDLKDKACIEECPVDCIYEGERSLYIHPDECVDCGACEPVCPVEAIYYEDDTPEQWAEYYKANVEFFDDLGSPGGAAKLGMIPKDHPIIAGLPPQAHEE